MPKVSKSTLKKTAEMAKVLRGRPPKGTAKAVKAKTGVKEIQLLPSVVTPKGIIAQLRVVFQPERNPANAKEMKRYMRDQFDYIGISSPRRRELAKEIMKSCSQLQLVDLHVLLQLLWKEPERDFQMFAVDCSSKYIRTLCGSSAADSMRSLLVVRGLITTKSWWDTVDLLASKAIGGLVTAHRKTLTPVMDKWIKDEHLWIRRTAILHQLAYKEKTDQKILFKYRYCLQCAHESDFFIRKAIGWALRNYFRINPAAVKTFVKANKDELSPLSQKEALKHA